MTKSKETKKTLSDKDSMQSANVQSPLKQREEHTQYKEKSRVKVANDRIRVVLRENVPVEKTPDKPKKKSNAAKYYKENAAKNNSGEVCQIDTLKTSSQSDRTLQGYEHLRDVAENKLNRTNARIEKLNNHFSDVVQPKIDKRNERNSYTANSFRIERHIKTVTDKTTGEKRNVVKYRPAFAKEDISHGQYQKQRYKVLSHRKGSTKVSAFMQETGQLADIINKRGVLHGISAISNKISISTPLDDIKVIRFVKKTANTAKTVALGTETVISETVNNAAESAVQALNEKVRHEIDNSDSDTLKAAKLAVTIGADILSDMNTARTHIIRENRNRRDRANDTAKEKFEFKQEKLEFQRQKAEFELNQAQKNIDSYKERKTESIVNSPFQEKKRVGRKEKTTVNMTDKTTVNKSADKQRAETSIVDERPTGLYERHLISLEKKRTRNENSAKPHMFVVKIRRSINAETGKTKRTVRIERKELSVTEKNNGFVRNTYRNVYRLSHGEICLPHKRDPYMLKEISDNISGRLTTRGLRSIREKAVSDGYDNDTVRAIDTTSRIAAGIGRSYDVSKKSALIIHDEVHSMLQPVRERVQNGLVNTERRIMEHKNNRSSMLQPHDEENKNKKSRKKDADLCDRKKQQYNNNRKQVFSVFKDREVKAQFISELFEKGKEEAKRYALAGVAIFIMIFTLPAMLLFAAGGGAGGASAVLSVASPTKDLDLSKSEEYWTELAEDLVKEYQEFVSKNEGDKYKISDSSVTNLDHDAFKLLAYLSVKCPKKSDLEDDDKKNMWKFKNAKKEIESIFNEQYEFVSGKTEKTVYKVNTVSREIITQEYPLGSTQWFSYQSKNYMSFAYIYGEYKVGEWTTDNTISDVYYDNGTKLSEPQTITFKNKHILSLLYPDNPPTVEQWKHVYNEQELTAITYKTYEYGIKEKKSFDEIIDERVAELDEKQQTEYQTYLNYHLGHYSFISPVQPFEIKEYAGYNTNVSGENGLKTSIKIKTTSGQEIMATCKGTLKKTGDNSCSICNKANKYTMEIENINLSVENGSVNKKNIIGTAASDDGIIVKIKDKSGKYINPYLFIRG